MFLKFRNRVLYWLGQHDKTPINGIEGGSDWHDAGYNSILFHWIMKEPLRKIVKFMPNVPQAWVDNLTGTQRLLYEIAKEKWYDVERNRERRDKLWKPFLYFLVLWQNDEMMEPCDAVFYEILNRRSEFYIPLGRLDPANWYMDYNPKRNNGPGRALNLFVEDPEVRYDTIQSDKVIVLIERPARNFICAHNESTGETEYILINRHVHIRTNDGGYAFAVIGRTDDLMTATTKGMEIDKW